MELRKIISWTFVVGLSGILVEPVKQLFCFIPWAKFLNIDSYKWLITPMLHISILHIILFIVLLAIVFSVWHIFKRQYIARNGKNKENIRKKLVVELKRFNHISFDDNQTVEVRWKVSEPSVYNLHYHSYNMEFYCLNHQTPLLMPHGHCPMRECANANFYVNTSDVKNQIDSMIIERARQLGLE